MRDICKLRTVAYVADLIGNQIESVTELQVFCESIPIQQSEFFKAAETGIKPSVRLKVRTADYSGQTQVEFSGEIYSIYRTYPAIEYTELYGEARIGV